MLTDEITINLDRTSFNIRRLMKINGDTATTLSEKTGLTPNTIRNYMSGKNPPSMKNLGVIADVYHVDISEIIVYKKGK